MKRCAWLIVLVALVCFPLTAQQGGLPSYGEPAISPDGSEIAFVSGGDIWSVPAAGGDARLLVAHPATESRPLYSPDGKSLAFVSARTGNGDLYLLDFESGSTRRLTFDDGADQLDAWSRDGKWLYFSSTARDVGGLSDVYRVPAAGGTPMLVASDRYTAEYFAAPAPDGKSLAFAARGLALAQWWRHGHAHIDESQIWLLRDDGIYMPLTKDGAKEIWPMWSSDGRTLYFSSDRNGAENLWSLPVGTTAGEAHAVTKFTAGRLLWPSISYDGRKIAFERDFGIWTLDPATGRASQLSIRRRGTPAGQTVEHRRITDHLGDLAVSPDGKKLVFSARGDLFAASTKEGGEAARITNTAADEGQVTWAPDNHTIVYTSDRDGRPHLFQYDFATERETQLTSGDGSDEAPRHSPDGKLVAFQRDGTTVMVLDLATKQARALAAALLDREPFGSERAFDWSPDSRWLAFLDYRGGLFRNAMVVPAAGGDAHPVSFLADGNADAISWSRDGRYLLMSTSQRSENGQLARIDLMPATPKFREDQFRDLFHEEKPASPAVKKPDEKAPAEDKKPEATAPAAKADETPGSKKAAKTEIDFDGIRERVTLLPVGLDVASQVISPDGKWVAMVATAAGQENLYVYSLDELATDPAVAKQLTSTSGSKRRLQFSPDSKEVYYLDQGRVNAVTIETSRPRSISVSAEMDVDFAREKGEAFEQAWRYMRDNFHDPKMHGVDWDAIHAEYRTRVAGAGTSDEFRRLLSLMIGELNASHLGARPPADATRITTGRLGLRFDRAEYEQNGRLRVTEVITLSPADVAKIKTGDFLLAVDGKAVGARTNLDELLDYHIGKKTTVTVASGADGSGRRDVVLQPVNGSTERNLTYRKWVNDNRDYVARASNGRLGYVHMFDMGSGSLDQLLIDLDVENRRDGVVIDVRNNNGGFVNAYALDIFARQPYLQMTQRGFPPAPARSALGQRALERPTILLTNRHSLSDAEDFTEGYRAMHLGKVVGEPTAGWIIYTGNTPLIDGTIFRIPGTRITDAQGRDLEMNPRPVDLFVQRPIGEASQKKDTQLDAAVKELLAEIDGKK
jgi:tricorn protease